MSEDEKEMPLSAGQAAAEIVNDNENADPSKEEKKEMPEETKPLSSFQSTEGLPVAKKSKGTGWKVATFIFLILTLCGAGFSAYLILVKDNPITSSNDTAENGTKCKAPEETKPEEGATPTPCEGTFADSGTISFKKTGLKLRLSDNYEFINYSYSSSAPYDENWTERLVIGGLSKNTYGYQNIPDFSRGAYESNGRTEDDFRKGWSALATITVFPRSYWDTNIQPIIDEAQANGVAAANVVVYKDDDYVVQYTHPQSIMSMTDWEQEWEMATTQTLENDIKNTNNWSK